MKRRQFVGYSLLFLGGCAAPQVSTSLGSNSTYENQSKKLRFAVTDIQGTEELELNYGQFRRALEQVLETPIEFFPVESYTAAAVALQSNQVDLVLTGPSEYVVINARTNAVPLIAITRPEYYSVIAVLADSSIQSIADLKGKSIAMSNIGSTGGHLGPTQILMDGGLQPNIDYQVEMLGVEKRAEALKNKTVNAWGGSMEDYQTYVLTEDYSDSNFLILEQGSALPNDLIVVNALLEPKQIETYKKRIIEAQDQLLKALVVSQETQKYQKSQFVPVQDSDYNIIRKIYQAMGAEELIQ